LSSPGRQTAVVADSTVYFPSELQSRLEIETVSLYVTIDGVQQPESEITDYPEFYERLRASESGATTSQPSIGDFTAVYEPLLDAGHEIVSVHLSAGISGTCEAARQARERLIAEGKEGERIQVVDSRSAAGGMSLVVAAAANAALAGFDGDAVVAKAEEACDSLKIWFGLDTLEYLRRGGRIGGAAAFIGSALQIKPILTFEEEVTPVERVRTRARSIERLRDYARQRHESGADAWTVQHIQSQEAADALAADCREIFGCEPVFMSEVGAVLGAHAGPGMLGVGSTTRAALGLPPA
jgi:DegV family protein with EDD domain